MGKIKYDNENYDYLSITLQTEKVDEMVSVYKNFLWEEVSRLENKNNPNVCYLTFKRPHNVENKDRLQYLQVVMENSINDFSSRFVNKHLKSLLFSTILAVLFVSALVLSILFLVNPYTYFTTVMSYITAPISIGGMIFVVIKSIKMFKDENRKFDYHAEDTGETLKNILLEVEELTRGAKLWKTVITP